ncbi:PucR family transcriptional regulator [Sporomusa sp.]|uniref:PucR family transcriptional regulator n=1 Tax=Sporomusa sp. TaxID=2078658 RepID=UPI002D0DA868|nr:PucR family transcriptional regulator ligand-binding domain-containing protein [Sporomusa sp.]HWR45983.1 PucR family transcriptional regulator ligand-binding domain-containing protein [Sporomusa sp.]
MIHCAGVSLREMLALPSLKQVRLIAGAGGLDKVVRSVNIMEVPDIIDWTQAGELLLTTVYSIRHDSTAQSRLIPELAVRNLAGLAIKPGRYIEKIPNIMIEQANEFNFPLLEIPYDVSFPDILNPILSEISHQQLAIIQRADEVHLHLNRVVLEGGDMQDIAGVLVASLNNNLAIIQTISNDAVVAPQEYDSDHQDIQKFIAANSRYGTGMGRGKVVLDGKETGYFRTAICVGKKWYGTISVLETKEPVSRCDEVTIERTAAVAALVLVNHLAVASVERRYYNEFLNEILIADPGEEKNLKGRARDLGIDLHNSHVVATICFHYKTDERAEECQLISQRIIQGLREKFPDIVAGFKLDSIVMFIPLPKNATGKDIDKVREKIKTILEQLVVRLSRPSTKEYSYIGVGRPGSGLAGIQSSYREAMQACQIGRKIWPKERICYYDALGIWRLLGNIQDKQELHVFIDETLGKILQYDQEKGAELLKTLEVYFECNGKLKKVTEKMFVHYNTILYRLDRIQQITGCSLEDATACLNLHLALKLLKIMKD